MTTVWMKLWGLPRKRSETSILDMCKTKITLIYVTFEGRTRNKEKNTLNERRSWDLGIYAWLPEVASYERSHDTGIGSLLGVEVGRRRNPLPTASFQMSRSFILISSGTTNACASGFVFAVSSLTELWVCSAQWTVVQLALAAPPKIPQVLSGFFRNHQHDFSLFPFLSTKLGSPFL